MTKKDDEKEEHPKLTYEPPRIVCIDLLVDEVLAVGCKTITGGGKFNTFVDCVGQSCVQWGS